MKWCPLHGSLNNASEIFTFPLVNFCSWTHWNNHMWCGCPWDSGSKSTWLGGPQTDQAPPLRADQVQRHRDKWSWNMKGIYSSETNTRKTVHQGLKDHLPSSANNSGFLSGEHETEVGGSMQLGGKVRSTIVRSRGQWFPPRDAGLPALLPALRDKLEIRTSSIRKLEVRWRW